MAFSKQRIKQIIKACSDNKINSNKLSNNTSIPQSTAYRILSGETQNPSDDHLAQIENFLRKQHPELFDGIGELIINNPLELDEDYTQLIGLISAKGDSRIVKNLIDKVFLDKHNAQEELVELRNQNEKLREAYKKVRNAIANL